MLTNRKNGPNLRRVLGTGLGAVFLLAAASAQAGTMTVNSLADPGVVNSSCELREAVIAANTNTANADCPVTGGRWARAPAL